ncbi:hypothetical protein [Acinetobacter lanii]|uniref:CheW-like domain-containing protein n=1 Tax=Acinetobacter lanii TaxID=2715163 RepID=A0A6G8S2K3_9GAMM|nr:hypothetical protein [Acinetobacter lanii]QIO08203.1 hypothetical protein G8D99_03615 [Acinetobacter lanii]
MSDTQQTKAMDLSQTQELQHLITVSTGFIDAYIIHCYEKVPMLLPQNIVLSALDSPAHVKTVQWHEKELPVYHVNGPARRYGVALVIEGEHIEQRFALMCEEMPKTIRIRISEVVDDEKASDHVSILQYVRISNQLYHVPDLAKIQAEIGIAV